MNVYAQVLSLMGIFEVANNVKPNIIVLGSDAWESFHAEVSSLHGPLVKNCMSSFFSKGYHYRGCRVLKTDEPGVWVGRVISPL